MVAWVGDRPRWPGWLSEVTGAIPRSRRSPEQYSEGRAEWLLRRQQGEERSESVRARKRARQEDSQGPEALAARRPITRALPSSGRPQRAGGTSGTRARAYTHGSKGRGHTVAAGGQPGRGVRPWPGIVAIKLWPRSPATKLLALWPGGMAARRGHDPGRGTE